MLDFTQTFSANFWTTLKFFLHQYSLSSLISTIIYFNFQFFEAILMLFYTVFSFNSLLYQVNLCELINFYSSWNHQKTQKLINWLKFANITREIWWQSLDKFYLPYNFRISPKRMIPFLSQSVSLDRVCTYRTIQKWSRSFGLCPPSVSSLLPDRFMFLYWVPSWRKKYQAMKLSIFTIMSW